MKKCPFCAEEILDDAIKCRFCGERLDARQKRKGCLIGCAMITAASILLLIILISIGIFVFTVFFHKVVPKVFGSPPYGSAPFAGGGWEDAVKYLNELFRTFFERLRELLLTRPQENRLTF